MSRRQRREHKKQLARRRNGGKRAAMALAGAAAIAAGTQAYADPIRFDNPPGPGHFDWTLSPGHEVLSVLSGAGSQPGVDGDPGSFTIFALTDGRGVKGSAPGDQNNLQQRNLYGYSFLVGFDAGELIPSSDPGISWGRAPAIYNGYYYAYYYAGVNTLLPEGTPTYLGVRFDLGSGLQYGWIGVERAGEEVDAFAWGYETVPGVPIPAGIPEPGTLAVLALGAAGLAGRRAKRQPRA